MLNTEIQRSPEKQPLEELSKELKHLARELADLEKDSINFNKEKVPQKDLNEIYAKALEIAKRLEVLVNNPEIFSVDAKEKDVTDILDHAASQIVQFEPAYMNKKMESNWQEVAASLKKDINDLSVNGIQGIYEKATEGEDWSADEDDIHERLKNASRIDDDN